VILLLLAPLASAERPLARVEDAVQSRRYWAVEGEGPVYPRWRNRRGTHQCWTWPDGVAERCDRYVGRSVVETRLFDAGGSPLTTTLVTANGPSVVTVHGMSAVEVDVSGWVERAVGPLQLRAPVAATGSTWPLGAGELRTEVVPVGAATVFDDTFGHDLRAWCACVVEDRTTTWIDDRPAVRYRVRHPHPTDPAVAEVWAVPGGSSVVLISFVVPAAAELGAIERDLADGRATVALARWTQEAK
jgi:hypothetical protein